MGIYASLQKFRELAIQVDLTPDKSYTIKGNIVRYVSISKFKRVLAPLFVKAGIDFGYDIDEITDLPTLTRAKVTFHLTDVATGETVSETVIADGDNVKDPSKGIPIALSYATRLFLSNRFLLVDGIDYTEDAESVEDILDKVAIPETVVTEKTTVVKEEKKSEEPTEKAPRTDDKAKEVPKDGNKEEKPSKTVTLAPMERSAANKCIKVIEEAYKSGTLVEDTYLKAKEIYDNLSCTADVTALMEIKSSIPKDNQKAGF